MLPIFLYAILKTSRNISASTKDKNSKYPGNPLFQITYSKKAEKVWNLIQASFILSDVEEIEPDPEELEALRRYEAGEPDYQPSISAENLKRELGL